MQHFNLHVKSQIMSWKGDFLFSQQNFLVTFEKTFVSIPLKSHFSFLLRIKTDIWDISHVHITVSTVSVSAILKESAKRVGEK